MSDEKVLLKIKRRYSKDESIKFLLDKISKISFEKGELLSEIAEMKHNHKKKIEELNAEIKRLGEVPTSNGKTKKQWAQDEMFVYMEKEAKELRQKNKELSKKNIHYRDQYFSLLAKTNKNENN